MRPARDWCILLEASSEWKRRSEELAHQLCLELNAILSLDSSVKFRVVQDAVPVNLESQILERYRHCQKILMSHSESEDKVLKAGCPETTLSYDHTATKGANSWITREDLEFVTRWIRQGNKQGLRDVLERLKQQMGNSGQSFNRIDETNLRFMLVHMLRELREVQALAEEHEVNFGMHCKGPYP